MQDATFLNPTVNKSENLIFYGTSKSRPIIHKYFQSLNCRTRIAITRLNPLLRLPEFKLRLTAEKIGLSVISAKEHCRVSLEITGTFGCAEIRIKKVLGATQTCPSLVRRISEMRCNFSNHVTKSPLSHKLGKA